MTGQNAVAQKASGARDSGCPCAAVGLFLWVLGSAVLAVGSDNLALAAETAAPSASAAPASIAAAETTNEALLKKLQEMEAHIQKLEAEVQKNRVGPSKGVTTNAGVQPSNGAIAVQSSPRPDGKPVPAPATATATATAGATPAANGKEVINLIAGGDTKPAVAPQVLPLAAGAVPAPNGKPALALIEDVAAGLSFGGYGEIKFGSFQNPSATPSGQRQFGFDAARAVLAPTYAFTNNIVFNAELEFEHGGFARDSDDKLAGSIDVEQIFIDFKFADWLTWRAPGIDLVPFGYINEHHEPNQFYSVNRPELYLGLIPSTWRGPATRIYGNLGSGVSYAAQMSQSVEDFGDSFDKRTDGNAVAAGTFQAGFTGSTALALSRPPVGDFRQLNNSIAYGGRLEYQPDWLPGIAGSVSGYFSPNTTPRGAHTDTGAALGSSSLAMLDTEFRYRPLNSGFEFRGEYVFVDFGNPANLRANNDGDSTNNVGKSQFGYSGEVAYHVPMGQIIGSQWEAIPFYRYTFENFQTSGYAGTDVNQPNGQGRMQFHTAGIAVVPSPKVELKATYQRALSDQPGGPKSDYVLGGVGFQF